MPLVIFTELWLDIPSSIMIWLLMANRSIKRLVGILYDVLMKVDKFILPANFVILYYEVDVDVPIILGRLFLATRRVVVDVERRDLRFRANEDELVFNFCGTLKLAKDLQMVSVIDRS